MFPRDKSMESESKVLSRKGDRGDLRIHQKYKNKGNRTVIILEERGQKKHFGPSIILWQKVQPS